MAIGKFWFIDRKGVQQEGDGMDAVMAAVARGDLLPDSQFYDAALSDWKQASDVPALAGTLGGQIHAPPPPPPPPPPVFSSPPPPPRPFVPDAFPPPVLVAPESPMFKPLTFLFMAGGAVLGAMSNRQPGSSFAFTLGSAAVGVVIVIGIIGLPILLLAKPRRRWMMWMNISLFMLLAMAWQLVKGPTTDIGSTPAPAIQNGPPNQGGNTSAPARGGGFVPSGGS